jgi:glycosyltransferase involved in cell wall biosynthesis
MAVKIPTISIIVPARNASATIGGTLESITPFTRIGEVEVIVVNDASEKAISNAASDYPVKIVDGDARGIAAARNIGVQSSKGSLILFTDADCRVSSTWLIAHINAHMRLGEMLMVGGSVASLAGAGFWARCDHYCSWYNVHPKLPAAWVPNHPSANISVTRSTLERVGPFCEDLPEAGGHEDAEWQGRLLKCGGRIWFEPQAMVWHVDRGDLKGFLRHNYQWGYNCLLVKSNAPVSRFSWAFKRPRIVIAAFFPFAVAHTAYTVFRWVRSWQMEPLVLSPFLFAGRLSYAIGMVVGGLKNTPKIK